jgi:porin
LIRFSDENPNPESFFAHAGIGRTSPIPGRQKDNFGIGYYYLAISHDLKKTFQPFTRLPVIGPSFDRGDEQGVEIFYNGRKDESRWGFGRSKCNGLWISFRGSQR